MTNSAFDLPRWSLDQALIWVSSRNPEWVTSGNSWIDFRLLHAPVWNPEKSEDEYDYDDMVVSSQDAEQQLLRAFQNGQIDVLTGTKKLDPTWFDEAEYLCGQEETLLENRRLPVSAQITMLSGGERYIQRLDPDEHKVRVRVPSAQVVACFPAQNQTATMQEDQASPGNEAEPISSISRPRRRGNVSLSSADTPFIKEMHDLYVSGAVASINAAAWKVVDRAPGSGAPQSKVDRLRRRYAKEYPADPAERSN